MQFRSTPKTLLGAAAMVAMGASLVTAQVRPTSTRRIPISKDAPGEVAKTDTVTVYKTDTLRVTNTLPGRTDTVRTTNTVYRTDTLSVPMMTPVRLPGGFYFGVGGGVTAPNGSLYNGNSAGPSAQAQLGWQGAKNLLGLRFDVNYGQPGEDSQYSAYQANPDIINFNGDVKLSLPLFHHLFGLTPRFGLYGIGGGSHVMYKNLPIRLEAGQPGGVGLANVRPGTNEWEHEWGWNAGAGASLGWNRYELFVESRVISFNTSTTGQARQMPFVLGINFY